MWRTVAIVLVSVLTTLACRQSKPDIASKSRAAPNYDFSFPNYQYAEKVSSLQTLDFKNIVVFWFAGAEPKSSVKLRDGSVLLKLKHGGYEKVHVDLVELVTSRLGEKAAIIDLQWDDCGGSCSSVGRVQVFELLARHPTVVQDIEYDRSALGTGGHFDATSQTLTVVGRSNDHTPDCCPGNLDVMRFTWNGKRLLFKDSQIARSSESERNQERSR
jgi:hypothetical protein